MNAYVCKHKCDYSGFKVFAAENSECTFLARKTLQIFRISKIIVTLKHPQADICAEKIDVLVKVKSALT